MAEREVQTSKTQSWLAVGAQCSQGSDALPCRCPSGFRDQGFSAAAVLCHSSVAVPVFCCSFSPTPLILLFAVMQALQPFGLLCTVIKDFPGCLYVA